jgi:sugar/nucleoside kinase (ribokinase family)
MQKYDILVAGDLNVDLIFNDIERMPHIGEEVLANQFEMVLGSSAGIMAANMAALGVAVGFVGVVGDDVFGRFLKDALMQKGVNHEFIVTRKGAQTGCTVVMNQQQNRANLTHAGAMATLSADDFPWSKMKDIPYVHVSNPFVLPLMLKNLTPFFEACKQLGMVTSMDPQWDVNEKWDLDMHQLLMHLDYFFPNAIEARKLFRGMDLETYDFNQKGKVIVTNGAQGVQLFSEQETIFQEAYRMEKMIDCIGAGDAFAAGFLAARIKGDSERLALQQGAICGALSTQVAGGTGAFLSWQEFEKKAGNLK